ncbi:hypothetical protein SOPP22_06750 [Shewanella sp. OPT22]|uniref:putative porin n=1 Tax=Parashewanella hymeniacidonis TaxID=2807618 RepID=UPI00101F3EFB|nr:putative porin [Parashewanella hymeniacidonis]MBM7071707.1 putative porin [Parashewanella hymeniacidonis]RYV02982.1 hypothetical protein SOPP22_06750 [Shewanella sp. OPT22]
MKSLSKLIISSVALTSFSAFSALDLDYQHEVSLQAKDQTGNSNSDTYWKGQYTYYAKPIEQTKGPYILNAFLAHSSQLTLMYGHKKDDNDYGIKGKWFVRDHWFIAGEYERAELYGDYFDRYHFEVGNYVNDYTKVYVSAERDDLGDKNGKLEIDTYSLGVKSFISLPNDTGVLLKAAYLFKDVETGAPKSDTNNIKLHAEYFFNQSFSIDAHYENGNNDDAQYGVKAAYFIRILDNLSLDLTAGKYFEPEDKDSGINWSARFVGRF